MLATVRPGFRMLGAILLTSLVSSLTGFINAVFAKSIDQINGILSFVLTPLTYCGGVFYSLSLLPPGRKARHSQIQSSIW
jgi:ABC-2 type transport system permease protein